MTTHPDELLLTRWLDGEAGAAPPGLADHLATCDWCQTRLARLADEAAVLRSALALTPVELMTLRRADLPGRVVAAVAGARPPAGPGRLHLLALFSLSLAVGLAWAVAGPLAEPVLGWLGRLLDLTTLASLAAVRVAVLATAAVAGGPWLSLGLLASELLVVIAGLLLVGLWLHRLRPLAAAGGAH
jgi:hypothetical protein